MDNAQNRSRDAAHQELDAACDSGGGGPNVGKMGQEARPGVTDDHARDAHRTHDERNDHFQRRRHQRDVHQEDASRQTLNAARERHDPVGGERPEKAEIDRREEACRRDVQGQQPAE
ncbi:MAG: hypothetical protein OXL68_09190 [Paracoccaceae bacterium]|nr:hypothetical protein [Paracoccaceae bacterium]